MNAWTFQDKKQLAKLGDKCPWSVGWYDPDGKRKQKTIGSKSLAEKHARKVEGQLAAGVYQNDARKSWADFKQEFEARICSTMEPATKAATLLALKYFADAVKPAKVASIKTQTIDDFIAKRRQDEGRHGEPVSAATVNRDLRHVKAALRVAHEWGYLPIVPKVRMLKENQKLKRHVTAEHFAAMYGACDAAPRPTQLPYPAADWWRALLTFAYMTGWRIRECLALKRADLDLDAAVAITRAADNKGRRDEAVPLHPIVVDHLRKLVSFHPFVFPYPHADRGLWDDFAAIQKAAGINLPCDEDHDHDDTCHRYGFHDFRRAFATLNAPTLSAHALQKLMRHKSMATTQGYVNMASQLQTAVAGLHVPDVLTKKQA